MKRWLAIVGWVAAACGSGGGGPVVPETISTFIVEAPRPLDADPTPTFRFVTNLPSASFELSVDDGAPATVQSPHTLAALADGSHRIHVYASDSAGNRDPVGVSHTWIVDTEPPQVTVTFPPPVAAVTGDRVAVCGRAMDDRSLASVTVNGAAALSTNGFATWRAVAPVASGENKLDIECLAAAGNRVAVPGPTITALTRGLEDPIALVMDGDSALALEAGRQSLVRVNLDSGRIGVVSDEIVGAGELPVTPVQFAANPTGENVVVFDASRCRLFTIDLDTGDRRMVRDATAADIFVGRPGLLCCDGKCAYVQGPPKVPLIEIELDTGDLRTVVDGHWAKDPVALEYDAAQDRLVVADVDNRVLAINIQTGAVSTVSTAPADATVRVGAWRGMAIDGSTGYVVSADRKGLVSVDLVTGARTRIDLSGHEILRPMDIRLNDARDEAFVLDTGLDMVVSIDLATGVVTPHAVEGTTLGGGEALGTLNHSVTCDPSAARALVIDVDRDCVVAVDCATADRAVVADFSSDGVPPTDVALNATGSEAVILRDDEITAVDMATGTRTEFPDDPLGDQYDGQTSIACDDQSGRVLVLGDQFAVPEVYSVDAATGQRAQIWFGAGTGLTPTGVEEDKGPGMDYHAPTQTIFVTSRSGQAVVAGRPGAVAVVTSRYTGSGPGLVDPVDVVFDAANERVLVLDAGLESILSVDLDTGDRTVLCSNSCGVGPQLTNALGLAFDNQTSLAFVTLIDRVVLVDVTNGDRVILAK